MYPNIVQRIYFLFIISLLSFSTRCTENLDLLYSTKFLKKHILVREVLKDYGFQHITFQTTDNLAIHGLFLSRPNATCNVIVGAGWLPGKKEGMASFFDLLPRHCNILFFDARGHGDSEGRLLWKLWEYGVHEYKDFLGAISYLNTVNSLPIVVLGICSGAFNAAHAFINLEKNQKIIPSQIKGLIFDSGWGSVTHITRTTPPAGIETRLADILTLIYSTKKEARKSMLYKICHLIAQTSYIMSYYLCIKPLVQQSEHITTLFDKIHSITSPILFIHSKDDTYTELSNAQKLAELALHKTCWWIEKSYHAKHHLIHKELYKDKVSQFIDNVIH